MNKSMPLKFRVIEKCWQNAKVNDLIKHIKLQERLSKAAQESLYNFFNNKFSYQLMPTYKCI